MKSKLAALIEKLVDDELDEISTSAGAGPYDSPYAFDGSGADTPVNKKKKDNPMDKGAQKPVSFGESKFDALKDKVAHEKGVTDPGGIAYAAGVKKYGKAGMEKKAEAGRKDEDVNESRYTAFKVSEGLPHQKIGKAIREINHQISEVEHLVGMASRLKNETNTTADRLWKNTGKGLAKMESRLASLAATIREMKK